MASDTIHAIESNPNSTQRQVGIDVARALAVIGMVIVNFKVVMGADKSGPDWLIWLVGLLDGRAAATFVILAGVGLSLLSRKARRQSDTIALAAKRNLIFKRAAFLFCFGLIYAPVWPADILHFYGIYLLIGGLMLSASDRKLWSMAIGFSVGFVVLLFFLDYDKGWDWNTLYYNDFWSPPGMVRHLFFNGFHPVIPWVSFLLIGMWLGRQELTQAITRRRILVWGLVAVVAAEIASNFLTNRILARFPELDAVDVMALFGTAPIPPNPLYILSASGSALMIIILCIAATQRLTFMAGFFEPLIATGQLALTLYVAHVVIGMGLLEATENLNNQNIIMAVVSAICFFTASMAFAVLWRRFFKQGPLEWAMRKFTG